MNEPNIMIFLLVILTLLLLWAAISDIARFRIPNAACLAIALLFFPYFISKSLEQEFSFGQLSWHLGISFSFLLFGFMLFAGNFLGAGDAKLLAALGLWAGKEYGLFVLFATVMAGGLLICLMRLIYIARLWRSDGTAIFLHKLVLGTLGGWQQPAPYGVALATGGVLLVYQELLKIIYPS
ncbi:MAG: A24 family peptidase [Alphaproteobacteria bacterium]